MTRTVRDIIQTGAKTPAEQIKLNVVVGGAGVLAVLLIAVPLFYLWVIRPVDAINRYEAAHDVDHLIALVGEGPSDTRAVAARALGRLGNRGAVPPLRDQFVKADAGSMLWCESAEALGKLGDEMAISELVQHLGTDHCSSVSREGLRGPTDELERIGSTAIPLLVRALADSQRGEASAAVLEALRWKPTTESERIHYWAASGNVTELRANWPTTMTVLAADLNSSVAPTAENAATVLIRMGTIESQPFLIESLDRGGHKGVAEILLNCGEPALVKAAQEWAERSGYDVKSMSGRRPVSWSKW